MQPLKPKAWYNSSTIRGAILTAISAIVVAILPSVQTLANNYCTERVPPDFSSLKQAQLKSHQEFCRENAEEIIKIIYTIVSVLGLGGSGIAIAGRTQIGDIWTPPGFPGPNREDFAPETSKTPTTADIQFSHAPHPQILTRELPQSPSLSEPGSHPNNGDRRLNYPGSDRHPVFANPEQGIS